MDPLYNSINKLYERAGYLQRYGLDLYIAIITVVLVVFAVGYYKIQSRIKPLRADWLRQRCNPSVIPYAGLVYRREGQSIMDATSENFTQCTQNILANISSYALQPFQYMVYMITQIFAEIVSAIKSIRAEFDKVRKTGASFTEDVMGRSLNIMTPIQQVIIGAKSAFNKASGVAAASVYTLLGSYLALKSLIGSIIEFIIVALVIFAAAIVALWIIPFTYPLAAAATVAFIAISVVCAILIVAFSDIFKGSTSRSLPGVPARCFDGNTVFTMADGREVPIAELDESFLNVELKNHEVLIGVVKASGKDLKMYDIDGIIVSGEHRVWLNDNTYTTVAELPGAKLLPDYHPEFVYCPVTHNGTIRIGKIRFMDWHDIDDDEFEIIKQYHKDIHWKIEIAEGLSPGLSGNTKIRLQNGQNVRLHNIRVGDVLKDGVYVYGIVKRLATNKWVCATTNTEIPSAKQNEILFNGRIQFDCNISKFDFKAYSTEELKNSRFATYDDNEWKYCYHLVTDKKHFYVDDIKVKDYDQILEYPLELAKSASS